MINAESLTEFWELLITNNKTTLAKCGVRCIRPIERTQYTLPKVKRHAGVITKLIAHRGDLKPTRVVVLGLLGMLNPSPTRYYASINEFCKLTYYI